MNRVILTLALAASLSACATTGTRIAAADAGIARVQSKFDAARRFAQIFLPFLPPEQRARVEALGTAVERAIDAARAATSTAARIEALAAARQAEADYRLATGN